MNDLKNPIKRPGSDWESLALSSLGIVMSKRYPTTKPGAQTYGGQWGMVHPKFLVEGIEMPMTPKNFINI